MAKARNDPDTYQMRYLNGVLKLLWLFTLPYIVARLYIFVEVFRSLAFLPPTAFVTTWTQSVPNLN